MNVYRFVETWKRIIATPILKLTIIQSRAFS